MKTLNKFVNDNPRLIGFAVIGLIAIISEIVVICSSNDLYSFAVKSWMLFFFDIYNFYYLELWGKKNNKRNKSPYKNIAAVSDLHWFSNCDCSAISLLVSIIFYCRKVHICHTAYNGSSRDSRHVWNFRLEITILEIISSYWHFCWFRDDAGDAYWRCTR